MCLYGLRKQVNCDYIEMVNIGSLKDVYRPKQGGNTRASFIRQHLQMDSSYSCSSTSLMLRAIALDSITGTALPTCLY